MADGGFDNIIRATILVLGLGVPLAISLVDSLNLTGFAAILAPLIPGLFLYFLVRFLI